MKAILIFLTFSMMVSLGHTACFPENNLKIYANTKSVSSDITEEQFHQAVKEMQDLYAPIFEKDYGATLQINADWEDATVNAYAQQSGKIWKVQMFGGLARHKETTLDGFRAVICHEIGHHIAGAVKKSYSWASNEGQADYYATTKCLRKYYDHYAQRIENHKIYREGKRTEEEMFAKDQCKLAFKFTADRATCFRSALAGQSLARLLGTLGGNGDVKFSVPDPKVASRTDHNHPKGQCRMDTYFQGALCDNDHDQLPDPSDVRVGYCTAIEGFKVGLRPACWYKASEYEK